jgi:hypothetical protein
MHSFLNRARIKQSGLDEVKAPIPSLFCEPVAAKKQQKHFSVLKSIDEATDAGRDAGVFFGRLIRPFGAAPSGRISGPSAEFISVTRLRPGLNSACKLRVRSQPLCAPMNNPYRRQRAEGGRVSLTLVLSHFT